MKTVRVLFLDDAPWFLPNLEKDDVKLQVEKEGSWGTMDVYSAPRSLCEEITRLTAEGLVDLVVVGNNCGAGIPKAQAIAPCLREKTIVVWNSYYTGLDRPYAVLGFKHFGSRSKLCELIPKVLELG